MTPFERAEKNVKDLAIKINLCQLILQTIEETEGLPPDEADSIWLIILTMLEKNDMMGDAN